MERKNTRKITLILEGGGLQGVYSAGVVDGMMQDAFWCRNVIGVSAGACNAMDYASCQPGRTFQCMAVEDKNLRFFGIRSLLKDGKFYNFEKCFQQFADHDFPYDYDQLDASGIQCDVIASDVEKGEAHCFHCHGCDHQVIKAARGSSSIPFLAKPYEVEGIQCLDGGVTNSIPLLYAEENYENNKIIVVLTKPYGYRKRKWNAIANAIVKMHYRKYPEFARALINRYAMYDKQIEEVEKQEKEGRIFVYRPAETYVSHYETNHDKLLNCYSHGLEDWKNRKKDLQAYLDK